MDANPLGAGFLGLEINGLLYCNSLLTAPWGVSFPRMEACAMLHVVMEGRCWVDVAGMPGVWAEEGDFVLLPHGAGHSIKSAPGSLAPDLFSLHREICSDRYERLVHGGGGAETKMICGVARFDHAESQRFLQALPPVIHVPSTEAQGRRGLTEMIAREAAMTRLGAEGVLVKLADVLIIQAIRHWVEHEADRNVGWFAALADERIGKALALIHQSPGQDWAVQTLAEEVAMSRAAFSERFTRLVGEPAMAYLTRLRMEIASRNLRDTPVTIGSLALELGYESEASFSRAFKRAMGASPGIWRRQARNNPYPGLASLL